MTSVTIIIPVKDEEEGLGYLLDEYSSSHFNNDKSFEFIFVIDGRTSDNSREIAEQFSQRIIDQRETHGKGSAIRQAVFEWGKNTSEKVVFLDADGSYSFASVLDVISELDAGADVVSGSRFLKESGRPNGMSRLHYFGNRLLSMISGIRNGKHVSDLCTGLWGFNSSALNGISIQSKGFDLEAELFGWSRKLDMKHEEIPVEWSQRRGGTSKLRSLRDGFIILLRIIRT